MDEKSREEELYSAHRSRMQTPVGKHCCLKPAAGSPRGSRSSQRTPPPPGCFTIQLLMGIPLGGRVSFHLPAARAAAAAPAAALAAARARQCLLAVLAALAFVPIDAHNNVVGGGSSCCGDRGCIFFSVSVRAKAVAVSDLNSSTNCETF
ncbi:hypothetical protein ZWY2020_040521 [Hordeum vulgare]|nr:hypothetical protein ZWY2020_040521 [Hordeum vulgare]